MICPKCKAEIADDMKFCIKCGAKLTKPEEKAFTPGPDVKADDKSVAFKPETEAKKTPAPSADVFVKQEPEAKNTASAQTHFCKKCGSQLKPGSKFCTKCGTPMDDSESAQTRQAAPIPAKKPVTGNVLGSSDQNAAKIDQPAAKQGGSKSMILIIALVICALIVAILLALKSFGAFSGTSSSDDKENNTTQQDNDQKEGDDDKEEGGIDAAKQEEIDALLEEIDACIVEGRTNKELPSPYETALNDYLILATEYDMAEDITDDASDVFIKYSDVIRDGVNRMNAQRVGSALYQQCVIFYSEAEEIATKLQDAGVTLYDLSILDEYAQIRDVYRDKYIAAINEFAYRDNWSRDEAWELAEDMASLKDENGDRLFFNENDPDDPVTLRYMFCHAMKLRKDIEKGLADGSLSYEQALDQIDEALKETDYNPQLLYDAIIYCNNAKMDDTAYVAAFNAIAGKIYTLQGITITVNPAEVSETCFDINHFWYFNDVTEGAETDYMVSDKNGTTAEMRAWIREEVRVNR